MLRWRPYFTSVMAAYVAGLGIAFAANAITHLGQPGILPSKLAGPMVYSCSVIPSRSTALTGGLTVAGPCSAALLYIVPFTLGAVALTAAVRGETGQLLKFTDKSMPPSKSAKENQG